MPRESRPHLKFLHRSDRLPELGHLRRGASVHELPPLHVSRTKIGWPSSWATRERLNGHSSGRPSASPSTAVPARPRPNTVVAAAAAVGMCEGTARRRQDGPFPSATKTARTWRPREDPLRGGLGDGGRAPAGRGRGPTATSADAVRLDGDDRNDEGRLARVLVNAIHHDRTPGRPLGATVQLEPKQAFDLIGGPPRGARPKRTKTRRTK